MMTAIEYREKNRMFHECYEKAVRNWISNNKSSYLAENIPYFRDGVICPEIWFEKNNSFRPLFILKEVSLGVDTLEKLPDFLETWGHTKTFEFVENPFDDIQVGTFRQWRRIVRLAAGLEEIHNYGTTWNYQKLDLNFKDGGEEYTGNIAGYKTEQYLHRTNNPTYNSIVKKIAVLELKKIGGGTSVISSLSLATQYYSDHVKEFQNMLCEQIELIDPTVIVCLGRECGVCISEQLTEIKSKITNCLWIDGYHHTRSSNVHFYDEPIAKYKQLLQK